MRSKSEIFERNMAKAKERRNPTPRMKTDWQLREIADRQREAMQNCAGLGSLGYQLEGFQSGALAQAQRQHSEGMRNMVDSMPLNPQHVSKVTAAVPAPWHQCEVNHTAVVIGGLIGLLVYVWWLL